MTGQSYYIGTSGWAYQGWKYSFYAGVARENWLRHFPRHFNAVEINPTFYGLQSSSTFEKWRNITPESFKFAIKGNKFVTHNRKLVNSAESVSLERERAAHLGGKLAVVVWQLPRGLKKDAERLKGFAAVLNGWHDTRHAIEFRNPTWFDDEIAALMEEYGLAVCMSDAADWPMWDRVTTDLIYIRLHGHSRTYASAYDQLQLQFWAGRIESWLAAGREVHVYFDNDAEGAAPYDALRLITLIKK